ncbi:Uncharacterised protein [Mycobacteroides abscessus]|nr:Uncharacterised protein [Mycobacteroides abscessus]
MGHPIVEPAIWREVVAPVLPILGVFGGRDVIRLPVDEILERAEVGGGDGFARRQRRIDGCDAAAHHRHTQSIQVDVMAQAEQVELVVPGAVQSELQQLTSQRHQRTLNIRRLFASKTGRII